MCTRTPRMRSTSAPRSWERCLAANMQAALTSRAVIDQAIGIMMSRTGVSAQEAFGKLRKLSQQEHLKVAAVANGIVLEAVRRAPAPRADGNR